MAAPIGREAARIYALSRELRDALEEFVARFPNREATEAAALGAHEQSLGSWHAGHYSGLPNECRGWLFLLNLMGEAGRRISKGAFTRRARAL